jgi:hypothetical protein
MLKHEHSHSGLRDDEAPGEETGAAPAAAIALIDIVDIRKVGGWSTARELLAVAVKNNTQNGGAGGMGYEFSGENSIPNGGVVDIDWRGELFDHLVATSTVCWEIGSACD